MRKSDKLKNIEEANKRILKESVNQQAKEDLKEQFYKLEALSRLDPWDIVNVLEELRREFNQY
jgi:Na+-transporting NADH:ubiquinone oxidoreductase subunit NqrA